MLVASRNQAMRLTRTGMKWLTVSGLEPQFRYIKKMCMNMKLPADQTAALFHIDRQKLSENTWQMICTELTGTWDRPPSKQQLEKFIKELRPVMAGQAENIIELVISAASCAAGALKETAVLVRSRFAGPATLAIAERLEADLRALFPEDFPSHCDASELKHYPRYIRAVEIMAQRAGSAPVKQQAKLDQVRKTAEIMSTVERYLKSREQEHIREMKQIRVMCRELMVSVYAPELGAMKGISMKRIMKTCDKIFKY